jgi:hypothetical protein
MITTDEQNEHRLAGEAEAGRFDNAGEEKNEEL